MDYQSDTQQYAANDSPMKGKRRSDLVPEDNVVILKEKVFIPVNDYPGYNFVGSLLGPGGSILQGLNKSLRAHIGIFGKGSMKDKSKEAELMNGDDPKHQHLKDPLHVLIDIKAPRSAAHSRMSEALLEIYTFMKPPNQQNQQQFNEGYGQGGYGGGGGGYGQGGYDGYDSGYAGGYNGAPQHGGRGGPPRGAGRGAGRGDSGGRGRGRGAPTGRYQPY